MPTKEQFLEWYMDIIQKTNLPTYHHCVDYNEIYSFFSSHNDRVVEEIKKLKKDQLFVAGKSRLENDIKLHGDGIYNEAIESCLSLMKPKEL